MVIPNVNQSGNTREGIRIVDRVKTIIAPSGPSSKRNSDCANTSIHSGSERIISRVHEDYRARDSANSLLTTILPSRLLFRTYLGAWR